MWILNGMAHYDTFGFIQFTVLLPPRVCSLQSAVCSLQMSYTAGQISAHYSSSKIRKTNLRLFRPEQGPRAVLEVD